MLGTLTDNQCRQILQRERVGRLGCSMDQKVYIIPLHFAFDGKYIYAHSKEGLKIKMMRNNPHVCFQVDCIDNPVNWRNVIVQGTYEELATTKGQRYTNQLLDEKFSCLLHSQSVQPGIHRNTEVKVLKELKPISFRISILKISGRYEKPDVARL